MINSSFNRVGVDSSTAAPISSAPHLQRLHSAFLRSIEAVPGGFVLREESGRKRQIIARDQVIPKGDALPRASPRQQRD